MRGEEKGGEVRRERKGRGKEGRVGKGGEVRKEEKGGEVINRTPYKCIVFTLYCDEKRISWH